MFSIMEEQQIDWGRIRACTKEDREAMLPFIDQLIGVMRNMDQKGILILEDYFSGENGFDPFEKLALQTIYNSIEGEVAEAALYHIVASSELTDAKYLEYIITIEFVKTLHHSKADLEEMRVILRAFLGTDFIELLPF